MTPKPCAVYHPLRYNASLAGSRGACSRAACSHLCLLVPAGHRCACPDQQPPPKRAAHELACDAAVEAPRALPRQCPCENGGLCTEAADGALQCVCRPPLQPPFCAGAAGEAAGRTATSAAVLVPVLLLAVLALGAAAAWFVVRKRPL